MLVICKSVFLVYSRLSVFYPLTGWFRKSLSGARFGRKAHGIQSDTQRSAAQSTKESAKGKLDESFAASLEYVC
jgi:hypothetical protein